MNFKKKKLAYLSPVGLQNIVHGIKSVDDGTSHVPILESRHVVGYHG
jgi:hypothetical protein